MIALYGLVGVGLVIVMVIYKQFIVVDRFLYIVKILQELDILKLIIFCAYCICQDVYCKWFLEQRKSRYNV